MAYNEGFAPIANKSARVLILGSMPSVASLQKQQYYAHPRNAFWPIMQRLFNAPPELSYSKKKAMLKQRSIAVWDVLAACFRPGSLDSAIDEQSILPNDFDRFFAGHKHLRYVFFNGGKAEQMYKKHVLPQVRELWPNLQYTRLPSTSPAMAVLSLEQKIARWQVVLQVLEE